MFHRLNRKYFWRVVLFGAGSLACADAAEINLGGKQDLVLSGQVRVEVLELSEELLTDREDDFVERIADLESPFVFDQSEAAIVEAEVEVEAEPIIDYDDASVLRVVAENFSRQVSGTMVRGTTSFLQLEGGTLIRPGASFPISIPQAQGQKFTVMVTQITGNSYTLKLGEAEQTVRLTGTALEGGGAARSE